MKGRQENGSTWLLRPLQLLAGWLGGILMLASAVAACGDLTSGGVGEVEILLAADSIPLGAQLVSMATGSPATGAPAVVSEAEPLTGTLTVHLQVEFQRGPDDWIEVTDGVQEFTLSLGSSDPVVLARRELPAGRYVRSRTRYHLIRAEIESGLRLDGEPFTGTVTVALPAEGRALVRPIEIHVVEGAVRSLVLELRAGRWLRRANPVERTVPQEEFEDAQELRPR